MRRKTILALLDTPEGVQFCDVDMKTIKPHDRNRDLVEMKYITGWKRSWGKGLPDKAVLKDFVDRRAHMFFYPTGTEDGMLRPERTTFIFGLMHKLDSHLRKEYERLDERFWKQDRRHVEEMSHKDKRIEDLEFETKEIRRDFNRRVMEILTERQRREWEMNKYDPERIPS